MRRRICFWHKADIPRLSSNFRFWGFPVTPLKTQAFLAYQPLDLRSALQCGRKGPWMRRFRGPGHLPTGSIRIGAWAEGHGVDSGRRSDA